MCEILWLMQVRDAGTTRVSQTSQKEKGARLFCLLASFSGFFKKIHHNLFTLGPEISAAFSNWEFHCAIQYACGFEEV